LSRSSTPPLPSSSQSRTTSAISSNPPSGAPPKS
jgi:hypothetical protein